MAIHLLKLMHRSVGTGIDLRTKSGRFLLPVSFPIRRTIGETRSSPTRSRKRQETYMFTRCCVRGFLLLCLVPALVGCANSGAGFRSGDTPGTQSLPVGQTVQFTAIGTYGNANHLSKQNITSAVTWTSSAPGVATVSATGLVTAVGAGSSRSRLLHRHITDQRVPTATLVATGSRSWRWGPRTRYFL